MKFFNRSPNGSTQGACTSNCGGGGSPVTTTSGTGSTGGPAPQGCIDIELMALSLNGNDPIVYNPGGQAKFQITITNSCSGTAYTAVVTNILPDGFTFSGSGVSAALANSSNNLSIAAISGNFAIKSNESSSVASQ